MQGNCQTVDTILIDTRDCDACTFHVPNVFTPNNDEYNQEFVFSAECDLSEISMEIFDRWGKLVFASSSTTWNGMIGNKEATNGIYYYSINCSFISPHRKKITRQLKGWVQILK